MAPRKLDVIASISISVIVLAVFETSLAAPVNGDGIGDPEKPMVQDVELGDLDASGNPVVTANIKPGEYDKEKNMAVGSRIGVRVRPQAAKDKERAWNPTLYGANDSLKFNVTGLTPDTQYEMQAVAERVDKDNNTIGVSYSNPYFFTTGGNRDEPITAAWIIAIIVIIIILIIILIICCLLIRNKGAKYPVQEKEKAQGREPMLPADRGFGEYSKPVDEEKMSLTGQGAAPSETDSMAEYGDGDPGKFTEDGSFIGQYAAPSKYPQIPAEAKRPTDSQTSPLTTYA